MNEKNMNALMERIGYQFKNTDLLKEALIHRSYANEHEMEKNINNEKLEFLGDAVLDLIATEYLYILKKDATEGDLSKIKSQLISEPIFSKISLEICLGEYLFLSNGETISGGRQRKSILGDAFEALIGAIFLDSNYDTVKKIALKFLKDKINNIDDIEETKDYKTTLQELFQSKYHVIPEYELISETGPDHNKHFEIVVKLKDEVIGLGNGNSKKEAEKNAAKEAYYICKEK